MTVTASARQVTNTRGVSASIWSMLRREHGAWGMLALPFLSATILARGVDGLILPAVLAVVAAFSIREPLVVLGRQLFVWREPTAESRLALRLLAGNLMILAASGAVLLAHRDWQLLLLLGVSASVLVGLTSIMTVLNRQRSIPLQLVSAIGLSSSALVAWLSAPAET